MTTSFKTGWHVLYVKSCQENKVHQLLQKNQIDSFLPMIKSIRQWSDRKKVIHKPLFPSYVFVKLNSSMDFHNALSMDGACTYIHFGREYARVREDEILKIKWFVNSEDISSIKASNGSFQVGEIRKIKLGALSGLECEILKVNNTNKMIVRLDSLSYKITASIPSYYLEQPSLI
ncbi:transcription antitermination factor NusG [Aquimarina sp. MAR_2010_214]|uniref:UpxY family transcription antiterminator n=1 Tax=Aquimarina sp. MAR_2010_214 TaxID=1250026 RepID=UPI000C713A07|nr:UpxY family transcription antiterminator [Aquimarina sp. MAR_2010_214]PKV49519.1 transcription antitermination factor NusG [Aquimarina sp. MAR_2010_214]